MIIDGLPGGGAEKVVLTLCQGIQKMGHDIILISLRDVCKFVIPKGVVYRVVIDKNQTPWRKLTELSRRASDLDRVIASIERTNGSFDLIFSNLHKTDRIVSRSKLLPRDRLWFCIHGIFSKSYLNHRTGLNRWLKKRKISAVYRQRNIVAVSRSIGDDLQNNLSINPNRLVIINNPFDISVIRKQAEEPCELAGQDYLVHVGRFHPNKRHDRLLKAYARSGIRAPLMLIGTGNVTIIDETKRLVEKLGIAERVRLLGFQTNPYKFIRNASLLVLSSDSEGFGNVLIEALLCDTPVVSTCCPGGPEEILKRVGMNSSLSELNELSLAEKMIQIYNNPPKINRQKLLSYDCNVICEQYLKLKK